LDRDVSNAATHLTRVEIHSVPGSASPPQGTALQDAPRRREHGLDWLRVMAFTLLIGYHSGMHFVPWPWTIKNPETTHWITWPMLFLNHWRLPLLFFISGAGTWFNLQRRGPGQFARERVVRLLLPFCVAVLLVAPPQTYLVLKLAGRHFASYFAFWSTLFSSVPYPIDPKGALHWHHLWFLPYLFVFSLGGLPLLMARWWTAWPPSASAPDASTF
jgi:hypothetical protein